MKKTIVLFTVFTFAFILLSSCEDDSATTNITVGTGDVNIQNNGSLEGDDSHTASSDTTDKNTTTTTTNITGFIKGSSDPNLNPMPDIVMSDMPDEDEYEYNFDMSAALKKENRLLALSDLVSYLNSIDPNDNLSFAFTSLESGCYFNYRADTTYDTCSVIKAPFALYLLEKGVDLNEEISCSNYIGGSGILTKSDVGKPFTVKTYIEYMIKYSDNCAYMTLLDHFGREDFTTYLKESGNTNTRLVNCSFGWMSAADAIFFLNDIYNARDTEIGKYLINLMENTEFNELITGAGLKYPIAHKFGDDETRICLHDTAIVFSDHPYLLSIFSKCNENTEMEKASAEFQTLTLLIDAYNNSMYE